MLYPLAYRACRALGALFLFVGLASATVSVFGVAAVGLDVTDMKGEVFIASFFGGVAFALFGTVLHES